MDPHRGKQMEFIPYGQKLQNVSSRTKERGGWASIATHRPPRWNPSWLGNGTHHSNYKEAGKSGLGADPRRGNGLNCTTFTVNYFGCQVQAENVNLRLCLNCN